MASVLEVKKGFPCSPARTILLQTAPRIRLCGRKKAKRDRRPHEPWWHPLCDSPLCPHCQTERSIDYYNALVAQFTGIDPQLLYIITLSLGPGNVSGHALATAMKKLDAAFDRLCRSVAWRKEVRRCGGPQHLRWEPETDSHEVGFRVHHQLIALARSKKPRWKPIANCHRRILGLPKSTPLKTYFYSAPLESLEEHAQYLCNVEQLIPGYDSKRPKEEWEMMNIPDEDLVAFMDAVKGKHRLYFRGADASRKPARTRPKRRRRS